MVSGPLHTFQKVVSLKVGENSDAISPKDKSSGIFVEGSFSIPDGGSDSWIYDKTNCVRDWKARVYATQEDLCM